MKRLWIGVLLTAAAQAQIFVSPAGDDTRNGSSSDEAVQTLGRAQELARQRLAAPGGLTDDLTIELAEGTYRLSSPLVLDARDSGSNGHAVIYAAAPGTHPIVSGGVQVTGWHVVDAARELWAANAPASLQNTRQLYVNGVRAYRARGRIPVALTKTADGYDASAATLSHWRHPADLEFVYTGGNALWSEGSYGLGPWTEPRCPVARIDGTHIVMAEPGWANCTERVEYPDRRFHRFANLVGPGSVGKVPEYLENAYELLGTPGQWYFDRSARVIYYVPRAGEDLETSDVEAPVLETLVEGRGTPDQPVHDLAFKGLQFSYATWLFPSTPEGFPEIQANLLVTGPNGYRLQGLAGMVPGGTAPFGNWTPIAGNLVFRCVRRVDFDDDAFAHLGGAGLVLGDGTQSSRVVGCVFTDISGNGVMLGGVDQPEATAPETTADNRIGDDYFHDVAAEYHGGAAIVVGYAQNTRVDHNQIDHVPYTGISMGWGGWLDKVRKPGVANTSHDNVVAANLIFDHMLLLADGAAIYTQGLTGPGLEHGEKVLGNVVHDQFSSGHALYSDNGSCYLTIAGNVILDTNFDNWGSRHADYYDGGDGSRYDPLTVEDNWWQQGDPDSSRKGVVEAHNHLISAIEQAPAATLADAGLERAYRRILGSSFASPAAPEPPSRVAVRAIDGGAVVAWNPPCFEGGAPIRSYTVTASSGQSETISAATFRSAGYAWITGLTDAKACTFTVVANNANGHSAPSLPSLPVTPTAGKARLPSAPRSVKVYRSGGMASVHFQAPPSDGGAPVTAYVLTINPGKRRVVFSGRAALTLGGTHTTFYVVDALAPTGGYQFSLAAANVAGEGPVATVAVP